MFTFKEGSWFLVKMVLWNTGVYIAVTILLIEIATLLGRNDKKRAEKGSEMRTASLLNPLASYLNA
jgi:hypothetical protein